MSPIGNPQNLLVAMGGNVGNPFITFFKYLFIPTVINLFCAYFLLKFFYKNEFSMTNLQANGEQIKHVRLSRVARISIILVICLIVAKVALAFVNLFVNIDFDFQLTYIALIGCAPILIYRFMSKKKKYRFHILRKIDWCTLIFFASMFILMESVWRTGFFQNLISNLSLNMTSIVAIMIISIIVSQFISNVPMVALFLPLIISAGASGKELMALAAGSTIAGNLFILGAASNIIIIQHAEKINNGESITFLEFAKVGIPLTIINTFVYLFFFWII
jgi:Na+/H+ antiporter NhaD/arsenite permease-like protein